MRSCVARVGAVASALPSLRSAFFKLVPVHSLYDNYGMAGLVTFTHKSTGALAHRGLLLFTSFLRLGMRSTQKVPGTPARCQTSFPIALKLFTKTFLVGSINRV
jgi:hypothetical protein